MAAFWIRALPCSYAFDYGESDTATWIWLQRHGQAIYGSASPAGLPMLRTNYPPVQILLGAVLAPSDAAIPLTGRLLALSGFVLGMVMLAMSVGAATASWRAGALGALLFAGTLRAGYMAAVCRSDALALGLGMCGVTVACLRARGWPVLSALLFAASLLTKHSLIVFPSGVVLWALLSQPRRGLLLGGLTAALIGAVIWRRHLLEPLLLWSLAPFSLVHLFSLLLTAVLPSGVGILLCVRLLRQWDALPQRAQRVLGPWAVIFLVGLLWTVALGRIGSGANYLLELLAALVVLCTAAAALGLLRRLFLVHLTVTLLETAGWVACLLLLILPEAQAEQAAARAALSGIPGRVFTEQTWQATAVGRPPVVIPFLSTQMAQSKRWDSAPLVQAFQQGEIVRALLNFSLDDPAGLSGHAGRFLPEVLDALRSRYVLLQRAGDLYIYGPR